jgi:YD repeat-containing protein
MIDVPAPADMTGHYDCTYDAWDRLVEVKDGETLIAKYEYDGLNRRVKKHFDSDAPADPNGIESYRHFYYNAAWQVVETRLSSSENTDPNTLDPEYRYVWSLRYIDAPVPM